MTNQEVPHELDDIWHVDRFVAGGVHCGVPDGGAVHLVRDAQGRGRRDDIFTAAEAASYLKIKRRLFDQLVREGKIPCLRISPKMLRFSREEMLAVFRRQDGRQ